MKIDFAKLHDGKAAGQHRCFTDRNFYGAVVIGHYSCQMRFYATKSAGVYCRFTLRSLDDCNVYYGVGSALGYGYDKASSALVYAMRDIGLEPDTIPGQGLSTAQQELVSALADAGYDTTHIIEVWE